MRTGSVVYVSRLKSSTLNPEVSDGCSARTDLHYGRPLVSGSSMHKEGL